MKQIATAFVKAKKAFSPALKDKTNPAFRSKYADLGACLEAVNEALLDNGIAVFQETHDDATGVTVETVFLHESGEAMRSGKFHVPAAKQDPQGYGSALTYARRYSLITACGIAPEDDDGNAATDTKRKQDAQPPALDMSPKARAGRITAGVVAGDASGAAVVLAGLTEKVRDAIWAHLSPETQDKLTSVWPEVAA
ncbi:ERF family protein [Variovorax sp. J22R193]|uniref:ERF family protein n=1 Tax=Variovorax fucosicus TaxID=3053517 RepID=UPI00257590FE|nr:ERF family protein [Variovorax sp. J22R193]MDM0041837.1 ERF family protein [Variovorax sp. J22R193]